MQQDLEDEKNEAIIKDLENKVESHEAALEKKDFVIQDLENKVKVTKLPWRRKTSSFTLWRVRWLKLKPKLTD
jgi:hypothetical protein